MREDFSRYERTSVGMRLGQGASRYLTWPLCNTGALIVTPYVVREVFRNLNKLPGNAEEVWYRLHKELVTQRDVITLDRPSLFNISKDRPILYSALAWADVLLTIDRGDFGELFGGTFYDLPVFKPRDFLKRERYLGKL